MAVFTYELNGNCAESYGPNVVLSLADVYGQAPWPIEELLPGPAQEHLRLNIVGMLARNI